MSTSAQRRNLISLLVRSDAQGNPIDLPGSRQVVAAFNDRDPAALARVLARHPGAWKTEMPHKSSVSITRDPHMAICMAVAINWPAGLDVLLASPGADPDARFDKHDRTALDMAIRMGRPAMVRRLLAAGATTGSREIAASIGAMFNKQYSQAWLSRCWRVMRALAAAGTSPWSSPGKPGMPSASTLLAMLDCYSHPDGGLGQALVLLEKFPPPRPQCQEIARHLAKNLRAGGVLWTPSASQSRQDITQSGIEPFFSALTRHCLHPGPMALVRAGAAQWESRSSLASATADRIRATILAGLSDCNAAQAKAVLASFHGHPCLTGPAHARLSSLAMATTIQASPSAPVHPRF